MPNDLTASQILAQCLRFDERGIKIERLHACQDSQWQVVLPEARRHGLLPVLNWQLSMLAPEIKLPPEARQLLHQANLQTASRNLLLYHELGEILQVFEKAHIPVILLKGLHLAEWVYENISMRPMSDLDLLVRRQDLDAAAQALLGLGYTPSRQYNTQSEARKHYHLPAFLNPKKTMVELHWHITYPAGPLEVGIKEIWQRAQPVTISGAQAMLMSPEDLLLMLAIHQCRHDFRLGLKPVFDIAVIIDHYQGSLRWKQITETARRWEAHKCLSLALYLAVDLLNAEIPPELFSELDPADFTPEIKNLARTRVEDLTASPPTSPFVLRLWGAEPLRSKIQLFFGGLFPPPETIIKRYDLGPGARKFSLYYHYLVNLVQIFKQYGKLTWQYMRREPSAVATVQEENTLNDWWKLPQP